MMMNSARVRSVTVDPSPPENRLDRRKMRTRAALVKAAQALIVAGKTNVPVLAITQAADVGLGSFYNHFQSKEDLFQAAVDEALDAHGARLDASTAPLTDPAEVFAEAFRVTGRLHRRLPELSMVLIKSGTALVSSDRGLAPRALRDIEAGIEAGRFTIRDPELALVAVAGAILCLGQFLHDNPDRDDADASDQLAEDLLRMFGIPADEAHEICSRPLPDLD